MAVTETTTQTTSLQEKRLFRFYRPEDGHASRAICGLTLAALFLWGAYSFHEWLPESWRNDPISKALQESLGSEFVLTWGVIASTALAIAFLYGIFWLINWPKWVDFLVETEAELKKVSWASRRQVVTESLVVVMTVLILGAYIFGIDTILYQVKQLPWDNLWDKIF
jgi:preprotein translocase SecE subunit